MACLCGAMLLIFTLLVPLVKAQTGSTQISLNTVSVANIIDNSSNSNSDGDDGGQNGTLILSASFTTGSPLNVSWVLPTFQRGGGTVNLEFEVSNSLNFSTGECSTTMRMRHSVAMTQNSRVFLRKLILRNQDCEMMLGWPSFSDLISSANSSQDFGGLSLAISAHGSVLEPSENFRLSPYMSNLTAKLASPQLSKFEVSKPWLRHQRLHYDAFHVLREKREYSFRRRDKQSGISEPRYWSSVGPNQMELYIPVRTSASSRGTLQLFFLKLKQLSGTDSILESVELERNIYLITRDGEEPVPNNSLFLKKIESKSHLFNDFDMAVSQYVPQFSVKAIGNPQPTVNVYRACADQIPEAMENFESREDNRYQVIKFFRLHNATKALEGSYTVIARSGNMEVRDVMSMGIVLRR